MLAGEFAAGLVPGSATGSLLAHQLRSTVIRQAFGWFLAAFGLAFTVYQLTIGRG